MRFTSLVIQTVAVVALSRSLNLNGFGSNKGSLLTLCSTRCFFHRVAFCHSIACLSFHSYSTLVIPFYISSIFIDGMSFFAQAEDVDTEPIVVLSEPETKDDAPYVPPQNAEKYTFEAEVHRMLDIVINSLYQNNDIFLRELISNASDALDKIRYLLLTDPETYKEDTELPLEVKVEYDENAHTLTIRDSGVGMTHDELVQNLGTVARSGTTKFMQALKDSGSKDDTISQIGQFGVGFYSTFLVADRVSVASKNPKEPTQHVWESTNGSSEFVVYPDPRGNTLVRGTEITLHLKEDCREYAKPFKLRELAKHYSEFVTYPISLRTTETTEVDVDEDDEFDEKPKKDEDDELEVGDDEETSEKPKKTKEVTSYSWDVLNGNQAIWTREKEDVSDDEYQAFYHLITSNEAENATTWSHFNAEGSINFKSLVYLPTEVPSNYKYGNMDTVSGAMRLYVRRVLIGDSFDLLPRYLGFIRGVIDSDDLPLNVNRETLQESKILKVIQKKVVRKAIDMIRQLAKDSEESKEEKKEGDADEDAEDEPKSNKYLEWYQKFSPNIKMGILDDYGNREKLVKLLRFVTSKSNSTFISLENYAKNMKEWQKDIYVLGCVDVETCSSSPFLQAFREKDVEVIFLTDAIDEYMVKNVRDFDGKKLIQISSENVKLNDEDEDLIKRREKVYQDKYKQLTKWLRKLYQGTVLRVQVAKRHLGSVPAIVTSSDYGNSANMERILKAQAYQQGVDASSIMAMKIFEINPRHPLIVKLLEGCPPEGDDGEKVVVAPEIVDAAWMLHDMAMMNGGFPIHDSIAHNARMTKILQSQFKLDSLALEPEINPPIEVDETPEANLGGGSMNMDDLDLDGIDLDGMNLEDLKAQMEGAGIHADEL
jgi:heat shock protein 90kDa beta